MPDDVTSADDPVGPEAETQIAAGSRAPEERTDPRLLELLVCPVTRTTLVYDAARQELISRAAGLAYPIRNGVAMMAADAARRLDEEPGAPG